jgi:hypothetical protein
MAKALDPKHLCESLFHAESEDDVVRILSEAGYWGEPKYWRHYGDVPNNWGQGGNQQSLAEAALAEKIVNSVDARLVNECWMSGIDPESDAAPKSIRAAVAKFFDRTSGTKMATGGYVEDWGKDKIREIAQDITLCATGTRPILNIVIADSGEGQTPERLPKTILSLNESNKSNTAFVQGQFNQGGTGALRFCGKHNLQLVISRRNQALVKPNGGARDQEWGFTVVRRERPAGSRRNSVLTYLAPLGIDAGQPDFKGEVLSFSADTVGLFPDKDGPYSRAASYGTAIKLYEYKYLGEKSNILRGRSLLSRLDLLLPEVALPVRMFEYRSNPKGEFLKPGSRETTLLGLRRRLIDSENVEAGFPVSVPFSPQGEKLVAHIFAFKPEGTARDEDDQDDDEKPKKKLGGILRYRKQEGVLFVRNGQTHGSLGKEFFTRNSIKMKPLADDLLVFVDCDELSNQQREDLFMASRDRLVGDEFRAVLIAALEKTLHDCEPLKALRNQRQQQRINDRFQEDRPLNEVLQSLIKSSPNLTALLQLGQRISAPFSTVLVGSDQSAVFKGEVYPTFFKIKNVEYGKPYERDCPINQRMRLTFETDARNDYFTRRIERGQFFLTWTDKSGAEKDASYVGPTLKDGIASVALDLPDEIAVGDNVSFAALAKDTRNTFEQSIVVRVKPETKKSNGGGGGSRRPPAEKDIKDRERPSQVAPPQIKRVYRDEWETHRFDEFTAMKVVAVGYEGEDDSTEIYEFQVNMDNTPLLNEIKLKRLDDVSARNQFLYANVLVGLSLLLEEKQAGEKGSKSGDEITAGVSIESRVEKTCRALAPFLLALTSLGEADLNETEDSEGLEGVG